VLQERHKLRAATFGVHNLALALVELVYERGGGRRPFDVRALPEYAAQLRAIREFRRNVWDAETAYQRVWAEWDARERRRHGG
jgi:hypothetical protein